MASERIAAFLAGDAGVGLLLDTLVAVCPFDSQAFLLQQALVIGHQFRQTLEGRRRLQDKPLHFPYSCVAIPVAIRATPREFSRDAGDQPMFSNIPRNLGPTPWGVKPAGRQNRRS